MCKQPPDTGEDFELRLPSDEMKKFSVLGSLVTRLEKIIREISGPNIK